MFSGIVEALSDILKIENKNTNNGVVRIFVSKPVHFNDIKVGDSICTNGVCLTVESFDDAQIQFCLGYETLTLLGQNFILWSKYGVNLERSLRYGDRVHGHLVTGHVDSLAEIVKTESEGECWFIDFKVQPQVAKYFWKKGSVCLGGVSLTVNEFQNNIVSVCLIPETIKSTNLSMYKSGDLISVESDYLAKAYLSMKVDIR